MEKCLIQKILQKKKIIDVISLEINAFRETHTDFPCNYCSLIMEVHNLRVPIFK